MENKEKRFIVSLVMHIFRQKLTRNWIKTSYIFLAGAFLAISVLTLIPSTRQVQAAAPFVACSPEQIRATQRWWLFGSRAIMDFGASGTDLTVSLNPSSINVSEGTTVVTDTTGELLFYSNGLSVWNKNHQAMPNGTGLLAAPSATQTVAAFPSLTLPGIYFVVHNGGANESGGVGPLRYSEVDMSLDGGLGDVTATKNVLLDGGANTATEGMTAIPNADNTGFWVVTATGGSEVGNNNIVAHEFDGDGPTDTIVRSPMSTPNGNQFGTLNISADLTKIVQHFGNSVGTSQLRLLEIDAATGIVTELVTWDSPVGGSNAYSADFSPSGDYVYATRIFGGGHLFRYDIVNNTTKTDLENNVEDLGSIGTNGGQVKRAPDGKMYVAARATSVLSVVNDPDNVANPDYVIGGLSLSPAGSQFGLPQTATGCPVPLNAPSNLTATPAGFDKADLDWSAPVDDGGDTLLGYKIERSTDGNSWTTIVSNTSNTDTTYQDSGLSPSTEYFYRVSAIYDTGPSDTSNVDSVVTLSQAPDCDEANVDCLTNSMTLNDAILEVDDTCTVQTAGINAESGVTAEDDAYQYPLGLMDFVLDCGTPGYTTTVTQYYFQPEGSAKDYILRKHVPSTGEYFTIDDYTLNDANLNGQNVLIATYEITDGGELDADGEVNGLITDPVGPATSGLVATGKNLLLFGIVSVLLISAAAGLQTIQLFLKLMKKTTS